jgi:hypothetical protein
MRVTPTGRVPLLRWLIVTETEPATHNVTISTTRSVVSLRVGQPGKQCQPRAPCERSGMWLVQLSAAGRLFVCNSRIRPDSEWGYWPAPTWRTPSWLAGDDADAAEAALVPIWELEPSQRRFGLVERLGHISDVLTRPRFTGSTQMTTLAQRIAAFTVEAAPKALPPGSSAAALPSSE